LVETSYKYEASILWNQDVQTDRTIASNKPDTIIRENEKGACMLVDFAISESKREGGKWCIK